MAGIVSAHLQLAPARAFGLAVAAWHDLKAPAWWRVKLTPLPAAIATGVGTAGPGLNLVIRVDTDDELAAEVRDMRGALRHRWNVDWFRVWPDAKHLPQEVTPRAKMQTHVHGAVVLPDGSLVYNYEFLGLVRLDKASRVVWRLPYRTHHSVHLDDDGTLWVSGQRERTAFDAHRPTDALPTDEYTVLQVSQEGRILKQWDVSQLLYQNGYDGLLFLGSPEPSQHSRDDRLHLNDVEPFSERMTPGRYRRGDVLVSLRNINTVFVFEQSTGAIKTMEVGRFINQHDPDFVDGNHWSVLDNDRRTGALSKRDELHLLRGYDDESRIAIYDARTAELQTYFAGTAEQPFYTGIMGKHQWLPDQHLLVTVAMRGRAFELDGSRQKVWEYSNITGPGQVALLEEVQRLPESYAALFPALDAPAPPPP